MHSENNTLDVGKNYSDILGRKITKANDIYDVLLQTWDENKLGTVPESKLVYLDAEERVIGIEPVLYDAFPCFDLDPQKAVLCAIKAKARSFILAQSNMFGWVTPSIYDLQLAEKLQELGEEHDVAFIDHMMISPTGYYLYTLDEYFLRDEPTL